MKHAMAALFQTHAFHKLPQPLVSWNHKEESIADLIGHWELKERMLLCRIESLLTFLLIEWLTEIGASKKAIRSIVLEIEYSRLAPKHPSFDAGLEETLKTHGFSRLEFFQRFGIVRFYSRSIFLYGINFIYHG